MASSLGSSLRANSDVMLDNDESQSNTNTDSISGSSKVSDLPINPDLTLLRRRDIQLGDVLGRGRYSEVNAIEVVHSSDDTTTTTSNLRPNGRYVMKHIQNKLFASRGHRRSARDLTNAIADLVTEAMYLAKLRHPHIVQLRGLTKGGTSALKRSKATGDDYFLVLDRMEETLDARIDQKWRKQPQTMALLVTKTRYAWQMAAALTYLHDHQILYRDFKPENIGFVLQDPSLEPNDPNRDRLQLFDFGLARELDFPPSEEDRLFSLSASGTRRYMAPEIFKGKGKYNYKADVYSFSIVFYECLAHTKPFADFTTQSHEELVCRLGGRPRWSDIEWPSDDCPLQPILTTLLQDAWHQNLLKRPSMARVSHRLEAILEQQGVSVAETERSASSTSTSVTRQVQHQQHFFANDPEAVIFLQKKTSTSELTVGTDPTSDSEVDDECKATQQQRWSHNSNTSNRSGVSSLGSMPRH